MGYRFFTRERNGARGASTEMPKEVAIEFARHCVEHGAIVERIEGDGEVLEGEELAKLLSEPRTRH